MQVTTINGLKIAVFSLDHCPPHVHVESKAGGWTARYQFTFWHKGVEYWDIKPPSAVVPANVDALIIATIKQHFAIVRKLWWTAMQDVCLINAYWDDVSDRVVRAATATTYRIVDGVYDVTTCETELTMQIPGSQQKVRVQL